MLRSLLLSAFVLLGFSIICPQFLNAQGGDTLVVQTFTYDDPSPTGFSAPYRGTFLFPDTSQKFEKILMYYDLKCDPATNQDGFDCGEWDYLTYTYVYDSTGWYDSTYRTSPNFRIGGATADSVALSYSPTYTLIQDWQKSLTVTDTNTLAQYVVGSGAISSSKPLGGSQHRSRYQYLWRSSELMAAGVDSGMIRGIGLELSGLGTELGFFQIRMKNSTLDSLSANQFEDSGFETVYRRNTSFTDTGFQSVLFPTPFNWDGTSNVIIEFSYDNGQAGSDHLVKAEMTAWPSGLYSEGNEHYLSFRGPDQVQVDPTILKDSLSTQITVSFWQYGDPNIQPQSDYAFEMRDSLNRRVVNVHLPWGNSRVYWDAGNSGTGSYDRINKLANFEDFAGQWNHWAFTKNAITGEMFIYLNGDLWHEGSGFFRTMEGVERFSIGSHANGTGNYDGFIDEFQVWNVALDSTTIRDNMFQSLSNSHPLWNHLLVYYPFNEGTGLEAIDASANNAAAHLNGYPDWRRPRGEALFRDIQQSFIRPNIQFDQSDYVFSIDSALVIDSLPNAPSAIVIYGNDPGGTIVPDGSPDHPTVPTDTILAWQIAAYQYVYDWAGNKVDSMLTNPDTIIYRQDIEYYSNIVRYEIGRYITPYGIGLDLGPDGTRWIFDVTDYAPILHDWVRLQAGNNQELLDLKFMMIKGTPPRTVKGIQNLWAGSFSYASILADTRGAAVQKVLNPDADMFQVKTRTTGHGFGGPSNCAEFCPKWHYLNINGNREFSWFLWDECADNFVYPQGGTWVYDRAGWCPGALVKTYEHELTGMVNPGDTIEIDYDMQDAGSFGPEGNYVLEAQLFSYGPPNTDIDVSIDDIVAPSREDRYSRRNPICDHPIIRISNRGGTAVTQMKFKYGVEGGFMDCYYHWTGTLDFLEEREIDLPRFNWTGLDSSNPLFFVEIMEINGAKDENEDNDRMEVPFDIVPNYEASTVLEIKTNFAATENAYKIYDKDGNIVKLNLGFPNNYVYRDTLNLPAGCYTFEFTDTGHDGISWWANNDGTGYVRMVNPAGGFYIIFEPDYGKDIVHQFTIGYNLGTEIPDVECDPNVSIEEPLESLNHVAVYPNPSSGSFQVDVALFRQQDIEISILNSLGANLYQKKHTAVLSDVFSMDMPLSAGMYFVQVRTANHVYTRPLVIEK